MPDEFATGLQGDQEDRVFGTLSQMGQMEPVNTPLPLIGIEKGYRFHLTILPCPLFMKNQPMTVSMVDGNLPFALAVPTTVNAGLGLEVEKTDCGQFLPQVAGETSGYRFRTTFGAAHFP